MLFSRRRALAFGLGGAAALACGGGLARLATGYRLPAGDVAIGLTPRELAIVRAVVEALLPADGDLPGGLELGIHQRIDEEVWSSPDPIRSDLSAAIELLEVLPLVHGYPGRFTRLSLLAREAFLLGCLTSDLGPVVQVVVALKQMCHLFYYCSDPTWGGIGYDGPWVLESRPPESSRRYAELLAAGRAS